MGSANKHNSKTQWDRKEFDKLKTTWSPERIAEDEKELKEIFKLAADCPLLAEALDWAEKHDIKFFIDRQAVNVGGYYSVGTGVMAVVPSALANPADAVEVLVHEIRHAWQNYNGLISWNDNTPCDGSFNDFFINNALIEADAKAFGNLAAAQITMIRAKEEVTNTGQPIPRWRQNYLSNHQKLVENESTGLGKKFLEWFRYSSTPRLYGDFFSKTYGKKWKLYEGALPPRNLEFENEPPQVTGMNIHDIHDVLRLGMNFSGTSNYLATLQPDILPKKILRPSLADTFWGAANDEQIKLTSNLRKAYLKQKLASTNRKKPRPWP